MARTRPSKEKIYINRKPDFIIEALLSAKTPKFIALHAKGGSGKSTLLKKFMDYEEYELPTVFISLASAEPTTMVDILLNDSITTTKNCENFEAIKEMLLKEPKLYNAIASASTDGVANKLEEYDKEWGEYAKIVFDGIKAFSKWRAKEYESKKKEILANTEFVLLSALAEDFSDYGLLMVDTFEKYKALNIKSTVIFKDDEEDDGKVTMSLKEQNCRLKDYLESLFYLFDKSTILLAGRNSLQELNFDIAKEETEDLSLDAFSQINIKEFFNSNFTKGKFKTMPSPEQLRQIEELTQGNPLLVSLFVEIIKDYTNEWEALDYAEMKRRVEDDKNFGLLYYMTDRVLSHFNDKDKLWRVVIPRVLTQEVEKVLFDSNSEIMNRLITVGLATAGKGKASNFYYLHDDVHRAIENYFEKEFKGNHSSWHDKEEVATLHKELIVFYENNELFGVNREFEKCYHTIMLKQDFERNYEVSREEFASMTLGSISLDFEIKRRVCKQFSILEDRQIKEMIKVWKEEKEKWNNLMSPTLYKRLYAISQEGKSNQITNDIELLLSLTKTKELENDDSLYYTMGIAYRKLEEYDKAIKAYNKAVEINPQKDEAYYNMGIAYYHLKEFDEVITCYKKAIHLNANKSGAYTNLFELQLTQNQAFDQELEEAYLKRFGNNKESKIKYNMLKVFENIAHGKESGLEVWKREYEGAVLDGWSFDELRAWIDEIKDTKTKERLLEALRVFEGIETKI